MFAHRHNLASLRILLFFGSVNDISTWVVMTEHLHVLTCDGDYALKMR